MTSKVLMLAILIVSSSMVGCFSEDDIIEEDPGYVWQEKVEIPCDLPNREDLICTEYLTGFETPILSLKNPVSDELWLVDLSGNITAWDGTLSRSVAHLNDLVSRCHYEQGLLGMEFDENYADSGMVLLSYVENGTCEGPNQSGLILAEAKIENGVLNESSIVVLREIEQPYRNHNGGHLLGIGNNQYLWGLGDGGGANDPYENGQNFTSPLGAIHLFHYLNNTISPVLNNTDGDSYILHYGLRNPWRFDVDPDGGLWIADVGQQCWEEINLVSTTEPSNLGWSEREGFDRFVPDSDCRHESEPVGEEFVDPVAVYSHEEGRCSVSGGYWMDWGPSSLQGGYMYGDFCSGTIWLIKMDSNGNWLPEEIDNTGTMIVGFGHGLNDELLIFSWAGSIYQISEL